MSAPRPTKASAHASPKSKSTHGPATGALSAPCITHDTGLVINPLVVRSRHGGIAHGEHAGRHGSDSLGSRISGTRHYSVGYLSYRLADHHGHSEVDAVVYTTAWNRAGSTALRLQRNQHRLLFPEQFRTPLQRLRSAIREHPITSEKIMAGLSKMRAARKLASTTKDDGGKA